MNILIDLVQRIHFRYVFQRRILRLAELFSLHLPRDVRELLDIGCGDGSISHLITRSRPEIHIQGLEVLDRTSCQIPYALFNGKTIPFVDKSFDCCIFIDVLHHADNQEQLLKEASRVSRSYIVIKDHSYEHAWQFFILKIMDWVGNRSYNVRLPYNYLRMEQWKALFNSLDLELVETVAVSGLYSRFVSFIFERKMQYIFVLRTSSL